MPSPYTAQGEFESPINPNSLTLKDKGKALIALSNQGYKPLSSLCEEIIIGVGDGI